MSERVSRFVAHSLVRPFVHLPESANSTRASPAGLIKLQIETQIFKEFQKVLKSSESLTELDWMGELASEWVSGYLEVPGFPLGPSSLAHMTRVV